MPKQNKQVAGTGDGGNPYAVGYSPTKVKQEPADSKNGGSHIFHVAATRGNMYEVIWLDHAKNGLDDGYMPYTFQLAKGDGSIIRDQNQLEDKTLVNLNITDWYSRRGTGSDVMKNSTASKGTYWNRRVLLKCNDPTQNEKERSSKDMEADLFQVVKLTIRLNQKIDTRSKVSNSYKIAKSVINETNRADGNLVSLDHYLLDSDVVSLLESNCTILGPSFAQDYPEAASVYFNPFRTSYPQAIHKYGFSKSLVVSDESLATANKLGQDTDDIESFRAN